MDKKEYQTIVNQLGRIMKVGSLELKDKETLYYIRRKYFNKIKDVKAMKRADDFKEVELLQDAISLISRNSHSNNVTDRATEALYALIDDIDENHEINDYYLNDTIKEIRNASRYAAFTDIQHSLTGKISNILNELDELE